MANFSKSYANAVSDSGNSNSEIIENIQDTPNKGKGRPKGITKKRKAFRGTPKKIIANSKKSFCELANLINLIVEFTFCILLYIKNIIVNLMV